MRALPFEKASSLTLGGLIIARENPENLKKLPTVD